MKENYKRFLAFALAFVMLVGTVLPVKVSAKTGPESEIPSTARLSTHDFDLSGSSDLTGLNFEKYGKNGALLSGLFGLNKSGGLNLQVPLGIKNASKINQGSSFLYLEKKAHKTEDGRIAYCLDLGRQYPDGIDMDLNRDEINKLDGAVLGVITKGYPNGNYTDFGLLSEEEFQYVTAIAIRMADGKAYTSKGRVVEGITVEDFDNGNIIPSHLYGKNKDAYEMLDPADKEVLDNRVARIENAVRKLLKEGKAYEAPKLELEVANPEGIAMAGEKVLIGPIKVKVSGEGAEKAILKDDVKVQPFYAEEGADVNANLSVKYLDINKEEVQTPDLKEGFYLEASSDVLSKLEMSFSVTAENLVGPTRAIHITDAESTDPHYERYQRMYVPGEEALRVEDKFLVYFTEKEVPKVEVRLSKTDLGGTPVAGATIEVKDASGNHVAGSPFITPEDGDIVIKDLEPGRYTFKETIAPDGYFLNEETMSFEVGVDGKITGKTVLKNMPVETDVVLSKRDLGGEPVAGATIEVKDASGNHVAGSPFITPEDGDIVIKDLKPGKYSFKETIAPEGYVLNEETMNFVVENDGEITGDTELINKKEAPKDDKFNVRIVKVDGENEAKKLEGAIFNLYMGETVVKENLKTDINGQLTIEDLAPGKYSLKEVKAPAGYVLAEEDTVFEIVDAKSVEEDIIVRNTSNKVVIEKTNSKDNTPLAGAEIEVKKDGVALEGSPFTTDKDGKINLKALAPGNYTFKEVKAPVGFALNDKEFAFKVLENGKAEGVFALTNDPIEGKVVKIDASTGKGLEGAEFEILKDGTAIEGSPFTTDKNGEISLEGLNLTEGKYVLREKKAPAGYRKIDKDFEFMVATDGKITGDLVVKNNPITAHLEKVTETGKGIAGAKFEIRDENNKLVLTVESDKDGKMELKGLAAGKYTAKEIEAPKGYIISNKDYSFEIDENGKLSGETRYENKETKVVITKVDQDGKKLYGAIFEIVDSNGKVLTKAKTNKEGTITIRRIPVGKYTLREVESPKGYVLENKEFSFTVEKDGKVTGDTTIKNVKSEITFKKLDKATNKPLAGAKFEVRQDKKVVAKVESDKNGNIVIQGLQPGKYNIIETKAPEGYIASSKAISFTVTKEGKLEGDNKIYNTQAVVVLTKKDLASGAVLEGAVLQVKDRTGKVMATVTTNKNGQAEVKGLGAGKYFVEETKAPDGYVKTDKTISFEIDEEGRVTGETTLFNKKEGVPVKRPEPNRTRPDSKVDPKQQDSVTQNNQTGKKPEKGPAENVKTGDENKYVGPVIIGVAVVALGGYALYSKKKKED